uniref:Uncharacterized protein n=1 Tax=Dunaliella tertiolecta TaxID=3047 RepID=A0A7S3QX84_DUNTE|eukprot:scaffold51364_cov19-Tisochrysis_lutea.AAC.2
MPALHFDINICRREVTTTWQVTTVLICSHLVVCAEDFACRVVADGKMTMLEVKIDGGGAGCAAERSKNMSQWWVDWIKRLGADVFDDLNGRSQASPIAPPGCVFIQIGQVLFTVYLPAVFPLQCMLQVAVCLRRYHGRCNSALGQQY